MFTTTNATFAVENPICWGLLNFLEERMPANTTNEDLRSTTSSSPPSSSSSSCRSSPVQMPFAKSTIMPVQPVHPNYSNLTDAQWEEKKVLDRMARTYKTRMCAHIATGYCPSGEQCHFAHNSQELRAVVLPAGYKTALCRTYTATGACPYGRKCMYVHRLLFK